MKCSAVQCSDVQCRAVQYSAVQCSAVQCSAVQYNTVKCGAVQCSEDNVLNSIENGVDNSASLNITNYTLATSSAGHISL